MTEIDRRLDFFVKNISSSVLNGVDVQTLAAAIGSSKSVHYFLDDIRLRTLKAVVSGNGAVNFSTSLGPSSSEDENSTVILFVRRASDPIEPENISKCLDIHMLQGSPLEGLYNALKGVWRPTLLEGSSKIVDKLPTRLEPLLKELESVLSTAVNQTSRSNKADLDSVADISTPADEFDFWMRLKSDRHFKDLAREVDRAFADIIGFNELDKLDFDGVSDLLNVTLDTLNSVWSCSSSDGMVFPQRRMEHFFRCVGAELTRYTQKQLTEISLWYGPAGDVASKLKASIGVTELWRGITYKLTAKFWQRADHAWEGPAYEDSSIQGLKNRLEHILSIRSLTDELTKMLTNEERASFKIERIFDLLEAAKPLHCNSYAEDQWLRAVREYERAIDPIEAAVAAHFRRNAAPILDRPQLLLQEFQKYEKLLQRPAIRRAMVSEREALLSLLRELVKKMEAAVDRVEASPDDENDDDGGDDDQGGRSSVVGAAATQRARLLSPRLGGIVLLRQIGAKVASIVSTSHGLLSDIDGYDRFESQCESLISRITSEEDGRFRAWLNEVQQKIDDEDPSLNLQGSLLGWKDGVLVVNFSESLVRFLREIRQLDELGFEIPKGSSRRKGVAEKAYEADKYYRYGILLKKTANFYNTISEQMIDVQEQLLLDSLTAFASIVTKPSATNHRGGDGDVSWSNPAECENYIRTLQDAADKLSSENRWLRKIHESLCVQSMSLMNTDLLRQVEVWKVKWRAIKDTVGSVRNKYSIKDSRTWILHWDHQIYKALEASYQMGLESLNENLPEIKVDMIFSSKKQLEFKPPLEQIRLMYYSEMKKFVAMPNAFEGFGNSAVYKRMGSRNAKRLLQVYFKAETLFEKLATLLGKYAGWVRLGQVDLDKLVEECVEVPEDYVVNFKTLRNKRKDIDRLPDQEKIDCCTVSLIPFKTFLEDLLHRVGDALLYTLRRGLLQEFKEVDEYLTHASGRLSTRPHTVEEIGSAKKEWKEIDGKKDDMRAVSRACVEKKKLLLQYSPGSAVDVSEVSMKMANLDGEGGRWEDFDIMLEAFNDVIEEQKEALKGTLDDEVTNTNMSIDKFANRWKQLKPSDVKSWEYTEVQRVFESLKDWTKQFTELQQAANKLTDSCMTFAMPKPRFDGLDALLEDIENTNKSWSMLKEYNDELQVMALQDWHSFSVNVYALQDFATKWVETLKPTMAKGGYDTVVEHIITTVDRIKKSVPALKYCRGEPFKDDHWTELLQGRLNMSRDVTRDNVKVEHFLSRLDILMEPGTLSFVKNLQARALGEVQIREALQELKGWERSAEIKMLTREESGRKLPLIKDWKDLFLEMGDKQSLLASLKESQFFKAFADQGLALEVKISTLDFVLHTLNSIQRKWVYLEPIFGRGALPSEEARFRRVDDDFGDVMMALSKDSKLFNLADEKLFPQLSDNLRGMLDQLERCQKALTDFLEAKRSSMPRFYFIGDDDLLEILGQAKNPSVIQSHLKKLFQGINKVKFNGDSTKITAMISSANEEVALIKPVTVNERVEDWLELLANEMRSTLAHILGECLRSPDKMWDFPSQIICLARAIRFTEDAEVAIEEGQAGLDQLHQQLTNELRMLTSKDLSGEPLLQLKMKSLVFDMVHHIDVLDQLRTKRTSRISDWQWKKQLRYYFESGRAIVRMYDAQFDYTYEYQGNAPKLVHTPLTDKCYLTLTQGMHMGFGGNPYGPAGTGKTESVKALASCLGRQVLVFNCDEALESTSMIRIFIGIVKCGAWGCFDEFNRLKEDQLSAISQQIQIIQDAIKLRVSPIQLLGHSIDVDFNSGIFVTLNPAGKGYGGRSRLPDNLKALFRPVAMGAPDNELIAEVSLVTEGFTQSKDLSSKIVSLFKLSNQLLSTQQHYDWGLRALKAVLNSGGRLIQSYKTQGMDVTPEIEYEILIKAVRVNTLSKLTFADTSKFLALIGDVFPGVKSADITGGELEEAIKEVIKDKPFFLVEDAAQIKKMIQLKESLDQRMGCVVVGPSGCGKSSLWRVLKAAMIKCGQPVVTHVMNPKSMHRERLLGHMDIDTREWADGVLTDAARKVVREPQEVRCWIICDGDVDPEWIESLNSVLDDNHLLTLPNGERINFGPNVNFLFETHDLRFASPATVSRMGMIFLSDEDLEVSRLIQRWLSMFPQEKRLLMSSWIDELFYKSLQFVLASEHVVESTLVGTVMNGLSQIKDTNSRQEFICAVIRGLGGNLSLSQRTAFGKQVFEWANERPPDSGAPLDCYADGSSYMPFQAAGRGRDYDPINLKEMGENSVIPTIHVQRTLTVLNSWIDNMEPFILVGPEGCGKSMMINHAFKRRRNIGIATLHCNAQTTADDVISKIAQTCSLFSAPEGRVYRPRDCERLVLYLKDINLPRPDMYDTCQLIAFLQQIITFGGFYDEALEFLRLERIQIVASINAATTVGRHPLSTRFTAIVRICAVDYPDTSELVSVYDAFLATVISSMKLGDNRWVQPSERERLANTIVEIYQKTREKFTVDDRRQYLFTPRDMTTWVRNLCRYDISVENLLDVVEHEACRIFRDRLVDNEACNRFDQQLSGILRSQFRHTVTVSDSYFTSLTSARGGGGGGGGGKKGGDSRDSDSNNAARELMGGKLNRMSDTDFKKLVTQGIMYYEREERELNMLLFPESMEHIAHIDRILSSFCGHMLLVGRSGAGRRNAVTVASYMLGYEFYTPAVSRGYGAKQFMADVKVALQTAGIRGEHVVLLVEDFQITTDAILEVINSLLSSGEVPGMYTHEELEPLLSPLREKMREEGTFRTPYEFFVSRVKKYLHIVLCMDPAHPRFLYRCESNPALYAQCTVQWIGEWRPATLKTIPLLMEGISDLVQGREDSKEEDSAGTGRGADGTGNGREESKSGGGESKRGESKSGRDSSRKSAPAAGPPPQQVDEARMNALIEMIMGIHGSCNTLGATPKDYVSFLRTWHGLFNIKKQELKRDLGHLEAGLSKLDTAAEVVHDLRTNAVQQEKDLRVAQAAADRAMDEISKALSGASDRRNEVADVKRTVADNEAKTQARKAEIEGELAEIQPILDMAKQAVGQIKSEHMNEIKSLPNPPEAIADVLAAVLMLLGMSDLSWQSMKKFLSNRGVKDDILNYDARKMPPELRKNVAKLIKKKSSSFEDDNIRRVSVAAAPMAMWVKANIKYSLVMEKIEPLQAELQDEVYKLQQSQKRLNRCEDELKEIDDRVAELKAEFGKRTAEAERLKRNLEIAGTTLDKAAGLIGQLGGEQARWKAQAGQLKGDLAKLPVKMLLAAGFATYLAKTPEDVRASMILQWQELTGVQGFAFKRIMSTESELLQWKGMGLPSDDLSQENSLVIANATDRVPFIIDPASACTEWLKAILTHDKSRPLEVVTHHDPRFTNQVELAVRFGKTLLILEVDGVEPMLYPLCRKDLSHQGPRYVVTVGDKAVDYNENFRLYLVTRNPEPDVPPDAASLVTQVNFTVTRSGLEGQLLGLAIQHEQPKLEKEKGELLRREEDFKVQLAALEKDLLQALATAEGNLLENTSLIESLSRTKEKAAEIEDALVKSAEASSKLDEQREVYRPFAKAGSKQFFLVKSLQGACHMYQFSLASFLMLFKESLAAEMSARTIDDRLKMLVMDLEVRALYFVGRALFKADRPMFALHLVKGMHKDHFQPKEWEIFTGSLVSSVSDGVPRGFPSWAPAERQAAFRLLSEHLPHLLHSLELDNAPKWQRFASSLEAEKDFPALRGISPFQRVLVIQAFRPDRLQTAILNFCTDMLRIESVSPPPLSLSALFAESTANTPMLLISSPGADASKELQEYAAKTVGANRYEELAMGGGQQDVAINLLRSAAKAGDWLCLKNLHLVVAWLPTLEKELSSLEPHENFRLWLTSEAHNSFPSILLQQSLKATFESPPGIKKNLQQTFESWDADTFPTNPIRARLLFLLSCFHAVVQERRTYIPQGWTKFYEFSYGDLRAGTFVMEAAADNATKGAGVIDWEAVYGLMEDAIYGGRIDNLYDLRVLRAYLGVFFSDKVASDRGGAEVLPDTLRMPNSADYESFRKVLGQLPDSDAPAVFSLPDNIERSLQRTTSAAVIKQLRALSALDVEASKFDREKWKLQLGPVLDLWQQMTASTPGVLGRRRNSFTGNTGAGAGAAAGKKGLNDPVDDFVAMESELSGDLCSVVDTGLTSLKKVLFGSGLLTPAIQAVASALLSGGVPADWTRRWEAGPEKPQAWLRELVRKRVALTKLKSISAKGSLLEEPLALGDFFNPATFINALRQQSARQLNTAIDRVTMISSWDKDPKQIKASCPLPCILSNLLLQGASFHGGTLQESAPDGTEMTPTPNVTIGFVPTDSPEAEQDRVGRSIGIPAYLSPTREEFLVEIRVPISSSEDNRKWLLSGVALFLSEDD